METPPTPPESFFATLPLASRGPVSHRTFVKWLSEALLIATRESSPVLMVIALDGLDERRDQTMIDAAAWQLCDVVGNEGLVCGLGGGRLAVWIASDGPLSPKAASTGLLGALSRPLLGAVRLPHGARLGMACWGRNGKTAEALFTAAAYALHQSQLAPFDEGETPWLGSVNRS